MKPVLSPRLAPSQPPHLCIIFEATGPFSAIGKIAMLQAEAALAAGWRVSVVAKRLADSLQGRVEWLKLYVPPRLFAVQWLTARRYIRRALGDPSRFDVIHGHQPQIADLCDVFQCHFLTRAAHELNCLLDNHGLKRGVEAAQKRAVLWAEDRCYSEQWNPATHMLFNSALTRDWFSRYYGLPASEEVMLYPSPPWRPVSRDDRVAARRGWGLQGTAATDDGIVVGFLGGLQVRKGYRKVIDALAAEKDIALLMGGQHSEGFDAPELAGRFRCLGLVEDTARFYAACDVLLLPSHFEPFGYVASEAVSRGVPVIATENVGALPHLLEHSAGAAWSEGAPLGPIVRAMVAGRQTYAAGCEAFTRSLSSQNQDARLLALYEQIRSRKSLASRPLPVAV